MKKEIRKKLPEIKKTINAFLVGEEGKISKQSIIKAGIVLGTVSLSTLSVAGTHSDAITHTNNLGTLTYDNVANAKTSHSQHASHSSEITAPVHGNSGGGGDTTSPTTHASHASHGSHGQW
jgi:hypothetical protein